MDVRILYNQLQDEIAADEAALAEKKDLVRLLKKRIDALPQGGLAALASASFSGQATLTVGKSFAQMVEEALPSLAGREFVVAEVADAMRANGVELEDKPNPKITTVLSRLQNTGLLERTFSGAGNVPNRYRLSTGIKAAEMTHAEPKLPTSIFE